YWLDPKNAEIITANIFAALARVDPAGAAVYEANRAAFLARLAAKLKEWEAKSAALHGIPLVAYHNSFAYFARRFRLDFVGILAYFGIQVLKRNVIFVDLALAQIAALGATVAFMLGHPALAPATYAYSLAFTLLAALLIAGTRVLAQRIPQEALIGVIYVV